MPLRPQIDLAALKQALIDNTGPGKRWSRRGLSLAAGMGPDGVRNILSGKSKNPEMSSVGGLAAALNIPFDDFMFWGKDIKFLPPKEIPLEGRVEAGVWREQSSFGNRLEQYIQTYSLVENSSHRFGLQIHGHSMDNIFPSGSYLDCVGIEGSGVDPKTGDYVIVETRAGRFRETTCKLMSKVDNESALVFNSSKPEFQQALSFSSRDHDDDRDVEARIIAVVVGFYQAIKPTSG